MKDERKTKKQLLEELQVLRRKVVKMEALEASEERFRLLYDNAPAGHQSLDENGYIIEVNQTWLDLLGYSKGEVIGQRFSRFITAGYQEFFKEAFLRFKETGEMHGQEFEMNRKDGSRTMISFDGKIRFGESGRIKQTHCMMHDVSGTMELKGEVELRQKELSARISIVSNVLGTFELGSRLDLILEEVLAFLNVKFGGIYMKEGEQLVLQTWKGLSPGLRAHLLSFPLSKIPNWIKEPSLFHVRLDRKGPIPDFAKKEGIQALASIPLVVPASGEGVKEEWLGTVFVASRQYSDLKARDVESIRGMARLFSLLIDHSRIYRRARERLERLKTLHRIDRAIIQQMELKDILHVVLDRVPVELGADAVAISLINGDRGEPEVFAMRLPNGSVIDQEAFTLAESLLHWFVERQENVIVYELAADPRLQMHQKTIRDFRLSSYLGVPLVAQDKTVGILHILTRDPTVFQKENVDFFRTMAGQVAIAIENVRLLEETRRRARELAEKVAELEAMTQALEKAIGRLAEAESIAHMGSWEWDIAEDELYWSDGIYPIFGLTPEEFGWTYEAFLDFVHPEDRDLVRNAIEEALYQQRPYSLDHRIVLPNGRERIVHEQAKVIFDKAGKPVRMVGTVRDITREKEIERVLTVQEKLATLGHVAAGVAHEIRNPLSGINVTLDAIRDNMNDPESREDLIELVVKAKAATGKIEAVVGRIMDLVRPGSARKKWIDMNDVLSQVISLHDVALRKIGITLETSLDRDLAQIFADSQLMEQVISNIFSNAMDAMGKIRGEKKLLITTHEERGNVIIKVCDSGPGVPPHERKRIFEPFHTTKETGSGIGLSLCQRIIADHAGTIKASTSDLGGAEFTIRIPIEKRTSQG